MAKAKTRLVALVTIYRGTAIKPEIVERGAMFDVAESEAAELVSRAFARLAPEEVQSVAESDAASAGESGQTSLV